MARPSDPDAPHAEAQSLDTVSSPQADVARQHALSGAAATPQLQAHAAGSAAAAFSAPSHVSVAAPAAGDNAPVIARTAAPASPAPTNPFTALDRETPPSTWIHAGATRAEAGYLDPSLGWVSVRADVAGNGLHAAIVPSSAEAAQVLGTHLAGLNTYLADHHGTAAELTVAAPEIDNHQAGQAGPGAFGQQSSSGQQENNSQGAAPAVGMASARPEDAASPLSAGQEISWAPVMSGGHISVIA